MHVALISPFDPEPEGQRHGAAHVGGVERVLAQTARSLEEHGHDVTLLCTTDGEAEARQAGRRRTVRVPRAATILRTPVARLAGHIPTDADVVHVPATYPFTTAPALRAAHEMGVASILDFHFEPVVPGPLGPLAVAAYRWKGPRAYPLADAVVVRSEEYARRAPSLRRIDPARMRVVPNGIDPERFRPDGPRQRGRYLLFVGRLVPYKGLDVLLHALARRPLGLPLLVAGDGPLRGALEDLAQRLGTEATFLGRVPDEELPSLYRGAALTVLPSVNGQEAFGVTLVESMACGTPVVATDLPGVASVARQGGLVALRGDAASLAQTLHTALRDPRLPAGPLLARRIHRRYAWDVVTAALLAVYRQVWAARRPAAAAKEVGHADSRSNPLL